MAHRHHADVTPLPPRCACDWWSATGPRLSPYPGWPRRLCHGPREVTPGWPLCVRRRLWPAPTAPDRWAAASQHSGSAPVRAPRLHFRRAFGRRSIAAARATAAAASTPTPIATRPNARAVTPGKARPARQPARPSTQPGEGAWPQRPGHAGLGEQAVGEFRVVRERLADPGPAPAGGVPNTDYAHCTLPLGASVSAATKPEQLGGKQRCSSTHATWGMSPAASIPGRPLL